MEVCNIQEGSQEAFAIKKLLNNIQNLEPLDAAANNAKGKRMYTGNQTMGDVDKATETIANLKGIPEFQKIQPTITSRDVTRNPLPRSPAVFQTLITRGIEFSTT